MFGTGASGVWGGEEEGGPAPLWAIGGARAAGCCVGGGGVWAVRTAEGNGLSGFGFGVLIALVEQAANVAQTEEQERGGR